MLNSSTAFLCGAVLLLGVSASAQDRRDDHHPDTAQMSIAQRHGDSRSYYDDRHRDWNDQEKQSYSRYREQHHYKDRDFSSSSERERQAYWKWRHKHPQ